MNSESRTEQDGVVHFDVFFLANFMVVKWGVEKMMLNNHFTFYLFPIYFKSFSSLLSQKLYNLYIVIGLCSVGPHQCKCQPQEECFSQVAAATRVPKKVVVCLIWKSGYFG